MAEGQGRVWTQDETRFLIILWANQTIQSRLETSRNREGIQMLVDGLAAEGYLCTPKQHKKISSEKIGATASQVIKPQQSPGLCYYNTSLTDMAYSQLQLNG
ncbi:hypothetical protein Bbelb_014140 [Branchiostoma belcheri]|nr:hypothetical protein Bbelb_014140 [Branchiostoma belcheri]